MLKNTKKKTHKNRKRKDYMKVKEAKGWSRMEKGIIIVVLKGQQE